MKFHHSVFLSFSLLLCISNVSAQSSLCVRKRLPVKGGKVNLSRAVSVANEGECPRNSVNVGTGFQSGNIIYGDGSSGELSVSEDFDLPAGTHLFSSITINGGATLNVASGTILRSTSTFVNNGTISVKGYAFGGSRLNFSGTTASAIGQTRPGAGLAPTSAPIGDFGDNTGILKGARTTPGFLFSYNTIVIFPTGPLGGGGGAFGGTDPEASFPASGGGDGGGVLSVFSQEELINNGFIYATGGDGGGPGAGGGGGGIVNLASGKSIASDGTVDVSGGDGTDGGVNAGAGGGGGGGLINFVAPIISSTGTTVISGGSGGSEVGAGGVSDSPRIGGGGGGASAGGGGEGASVYADGSTGFTFSVPNGLDGQVRSFTADPKYLFK